MQAIEISKLDAVSSGEPTYWPTHTRKISDLIDFCIIEDLSKELIECKSCFDLSSDHSLVLISLCRRIKLTSKPYRLHNQYTKGPLS